jgi:hypothetical protein
MVASNTPPLPIAEAVVRGGGGGRRPTIDLAVVGRAFFESNGFYREAMDRAMKMDVPTMGPHIDLK